MPRASAKRRGSTLPGPLALRTSGVDVTPELRELVRWRMGRRLGKFAPHIERLTVRFEDVNGPRGGVDTACRIKVVLSGLPSAVVEESAADAEMAFNRADGRVERVVRRAIGRARGRGTLTSRRPSVDRAPSRSAGAITRTAPTSTAARNFKRDTRKATAALEDSAQGRPSRKSTRGGINRLRQSNKLTRRQVRRVTSQKKRRTQAKNKR